MLKVYVNAMNLLRSLKDERGQDMVEYAIMLGIIAVGVVASVQTVGAYVTAAWAALATAL